MYGTVRRQGAFDLVVVAASQGGFRAYRQVLTSLPAQFPAAVVLLQHRPVRLPDWLPDVLTQQVRRTVKAAELGARPRPGEVYVAPSDRQLLVASDGSFALAERQKRFAMADPLLSSAAAGYGARAIAVILSGRLNDGAAGVRAVKQAGGRVLVQDEATAECFGMPAAAIATGCVDFVLPVGAIAPALITLAMAPGAAAWLRVPVPPWALLPATPPQGARAVS